MFPTSNFALLESGRRFVSRLAMAAALAGASVGGAMVLASPAAAQDYSRGFVAAYEPVAEVINTEGGDIASVSGQFPAVIAAAETADDQFAAGNMVLMAGNRANNPQWQRQGLELMVASGQTPPEQVGQFQFFIGNLAYSAQDYGAARTALQAAQEAGYSDPEADIEGLIVESYFAEGNSQQGISYIKQAAQEQQAAGGQVPERWLLRALQSTYDQQLAGEAVEISTMLLSAYPTERNWLNTLQVVNALNEFPPQEQLDLLRLMRETNAMTQRAEFVRYIEAADPRVMANEVNDVLAAGLAAGQFSAGDDYYEEVKGVADRRATANASEVPQMVNEAREGSDPRLASEAGDLLFSMSDYTQAEAMYQLALEKGHADRDTVLTRLGMAQAKQGKFGEAQASFEEVNGQRGPIAQMWALYAQTRAG